MRHCINNKQNLGDHETYVGCVQGATITVFITTFFMMLYTQEFFPLFKGCGFYTALLLSKDKGQITLQTSLSRHLEDRKYSLKNTGYKIFGFSQTFLSIFFLCWVVLVNLSSLVARTLGTGL